MSTVIFGPVPFLSVLDQCGLAVPNRRNRRIDDAVSMAVLMVKKDLGHRLARRFQGNRDRSTGRGKPPMGVHTLMTWSGGDLRGGEQVAPTSPYPTEEQPNRSGLGLPATLVAIFARDISSRTTQSLLI